jgi:hypothetical protein
VTGDRLTLTSFGSPSDEKSFQLEAEGKCGAACHAAAEEKDALRIEFPIGGGSGGDELDKRAWEEHGNVKRVRGESCDGIV